jgi:sugar phosphate isomerase/epimerase
MRYAICNETFDGWNHLEICRVCAELGYQGLEIAPFTLGRLITDVTTDERRRLKEQAEQHGLQIIGLHWLLAKTEGLHLTSPDAAIRKRTADYLVALARACRDMGGTLIIFGSPAQRRIPAGATPAQATDFAVDTFQRALPGIVDAGIKLCLEPLAPAEADFINSCDEAMAILNRIPHPNFVLHLDVKAMSSESAPVPDLIRRYGTLAGHFHANDANRRGPGFGATDFVPIFEALHGSGYKGWVSVEVFDYSPDPVTIARESIRYMKECDAKMRTPR